MKMSASIRPGATSGAQASFMQKAKNAALVATDRAARRALEEIRSDMQSSGLGRLGNALGAGSDLKKNKRVYEKGGGLWSASGHVHIRSKSERAVGAIISYTEGATITPRRGSLLWFPTDDIQRLVGKGSDRKRLEPRYWRQYGLESKIGPLEPITAKDGTRLLIVKNVGVSGSGKSRSARSLTKSGRPRKGQVARDFVVAFVGIPQTMRKRRTNPLAIAQRVANDLRGELGSMFNVSVS
jgi:hypothetical protein